MGEIEVWLESGNPLDETAASTTTQNSHHEPVTLPLPARSSRLGEQ
jgi:hypothetical protein